MARPLKQGVDYFSVDVIFDDSMEFIISEHGAEGLGIVIGLYQKIYREGYYTEWDNKALSLFSRKINAKKEIIVKVIESCFNENIFDRSLYEKYKILTSRGIQNRYLKICKDCKRKSVIINKNYLLDVNSELMEVISEFTGVSSGENSINSGESTQRKGKEIERKGNRKEIEIKLSTDEANFIDILKTIDNYPLDVENDVKMYHDLLERYPQLDILQAIKKFAIYKKDKPLTKNSNARSQIDTSFKKYVEWGQCLKEQKEKSKREVWV